MGRRPFAPYAHLSVFLVAFAESIGARAYAHLCFCGRKGVFLAIVIHHWNYGWRKETKSKWVLTGKFVKMSLFAAQCFVCAQL